MINSINGHIEFNPIVAAIMPEAKVAQLQTMFDARNARVDLLTRDQRTEAVVAAFDSNPDSQLRSEVAAAFIETINLNRWADNVMLALTDMKDIGPNDFIEIVNRQNQVYPVLETHAQGEAPNQHFINPNTADHVFAFKLNTGIIDFPIISGTTGPLNLVQEVLGDAARSMDQTLNTELYTLIDAAWGTYPAGSEVTDARIVAGTLPTTSKITDTAQGSFTHDVMKQIADHFIRLGETVKFLVINPADLEQTWDWQTEVSFIASGSQDGRTLVTTRIKDDILRTGFAPNMYGQEFVWILDPTRPQNYVEAYSGPPTTLYKKPDLARTKVYNEDEMETLGKGEDMNGVKMVEWVKPLILSPQFRKALQIQYKA